MKILLGVSVSMKKVGFEPTKYYTIDLQSTAVDPLAIFSIANGI